LTFIDKGDAMKKNHLRLLAIAVGAVACACGLFFLLHPVWDKIGSGTSFLILLGGIIASIWGFYAAHYWKDDQVMVYADKQGNYDIGDRWVGAVVSSSGTIYTIRNSSGFEISVSLACIRGLADG